MHILLIEDRINADTPFLTTLDQVTDSCVVRKADSLQEGIEALEHQDEVFDLVICDYHGTSNLLLGTLMSLIDKFPCVICVENEASRTALSTQFALDTLIQIIIRPKLQVEFSSAIDGYLSKSLINDLDTADTHFVRLKPELLIESSPVAADVYVRILDNKYCKLFRKGDTFDANDLERYRDRKNVEFFYLRKEAYVKFLDTQETALTALVNSPDSTSADVERRATLALESLHTLVDRMGFTPAAQKLAKASVQATLKLIGNRPQLAPILGRLKLDQGKYITSHSLALAQISCALAHRIGWTSTPTYLKLSLASFLHDLPLKDNTLARCTTLAEAQEGGFSDEDTRAFKMHPMLAAEYAREFHDIPPDVDTILMQHHERPDGSGFPRGLTSGRLSPLSCLFIIAHDLVHFALHEGAGYPDQFFTIKSDQYDFGTFKKIMTALKNGTTLDLGGTF